MKKDKQRIVDIASSDLHGLFQREAERMVKEHLCEGKPCEQLCPKARNDIKMVVQLIWKQYARWN